MKAKTTKNNGIITGTIYLEKLAVFWENKFRIVTKANIPKKVPTKVPKT